MATRLKVEVARKMRTVGGEEFEVTLVPGGQHDDRIRIREKGRRASYEVTVGSAHLYAVRRTVDAMPRKKRTVKRGLLTLGGGAR